MAKKKKSDIKKLTEEIHEYRKQELAEFKKVGAEEHKIEAELSDFEKDLKELKKSVKGGVIEEFTWKDIARGIVGAIFGMSIMAWHETVIHNAVQLPWINILLIVGLTSLAGSSVLYFSQYRKIKEKWIIHKLLPKRFVIFYLLAIIVVTVSYLLLGFITPGITPLSDAVKLVLVISLPAMMGASAADIIKA